MAPFQDMSSRALCSCVVQSNRLVANAPLCGLGVSVIHINFPIVPVQWLHPGPRPLTVSNYPTDASWCLHGLTSFLHPDRDLCVFHSPLPATMHCSLFLRCLTDLLAVTTQLFPSPPPRTLKIPFWQAHPGGMCRAPINKNQLSPDVLP